MPQRKSGCYKANRQKTNDAKEIRLLPAVVLGTTSMGAQHHYYPSSI